MYSNWRFFQMIISNIERVVAKVDLTIGANYSSLSMDSADESKIFAIIRSEYELLVKYISEIKNEKELFIHSFEYSLIKHRFAYLDPLNYLQVALIKKQRESQQNSKKTDINIEAQIHLTINGISSGLRNTG